MADPREFDALGRHWDAALRGVPAPTPNELDPALAETVARLHAIDDLPDPDAVFAERLWRELRAGGGRAGGGRVAPTTEGAAWNGLPPGAASAPLALPPRRPSRAWGVIELAAAVLLLLIPIGGYLVGYRVLPELAGLWPGDDGGHETADVPLYRGDAARTGAMPGPGPNGAPIRAWRFDPAIGESVYFAPVIAGDLVYVGTATGSLVAIESATGEERWRFTTETGAIVSEAPAIAGETIYVGSQDSYLYALDAATGAERWRVQIGSVEAPPVVVDSVIYVTDTTNFNERTYLALADGLVVFNGCVCGSVRALDAESGRQRWVYRPETAGLFAVDTATGDEVWRRPTTGMVTSAPTIAAGVVFAVEQDATLLAVDAATGEERWRYPLTAGVGVNMIARSAPAVVAGVVYVGTVEGALHAVDAATGAARWSVTLGFWIASSPAVAEGVVYIGTMDGDVHAVEAATGARRWVYAVGSSAPGSPVVANGTVYIVDSLGVLLALADAEAPPDGHARASPGA